MANIDFTRLDERKVIIEQIESSENYARKKASQRAFDIYNDLIEPYLLEILRKEFSANTVSQLRKCYSINISKRIVAEEASLYVSEPIRTFGNVSEKELEQLQNIYAHSNTNTKLLYANRYYRVFMQDFLQVLPHNNILETRVFGPHQLDAIPDSTDPRQAYAYVQNVWPKYQQWTGKNDTSGYSQNDLMNQKIADPDDRSQEEKEYIAWTPEYNLKFDNKGEIISEITENPIGVLPFVDISTQKDAAFFVNRGYPITDYALELSVDLSDLSSIARMQGWAYAIVYSENPPTNLVVGPNQVLWMKLDPNKPELQPKFEFVSPSPNLSSQLEVLQSKLRIFLASRNIKSKAISGDAGTTDAYTSGVDRLLSMIDRYESSREDIALFRSAEDKLFDLYRKWTNAWIDYNDENALIDQLRLSKINEEAWVDVKYSKPEAVQTDTEKRDGVIKEIENQLKSRAEAIMELREVDRETAEKILSEIDADLLGSLANQVGNA